MILTSTRIDLAKLADRNDNLENELLIQKKRTEKAVSDRKDAAEMFKICEKKAREDIMKLEAEIKALKNETRLCEDGK